jgi:hypothetical protein
MILAHRARLLVRQGRLASPPDAATQAGVIVRHASVQGQAGDHGEWTKRPSAPGGRAGYLATR